MCLKIERDLVIIDIFGDWPSGKAPALGAGDREFESHIPDHFALLNVNYIMKRMLYYVYIVRCCDNYLYIGITNNLQKRVSQHNLGLSKITKNRRPIKLSIMNVLKVEGRL